jgi:hypothetical protein
MSLNHWLDVQACHLSVHHGSANLLQLPSFCHSQQLTPLSKHVM